MLNQNLKTWTPPPPMENRQELSFDALIPKFLDYIEIELNRPKETVAKYKECLIWVKRYMDHLVSPTQITKDDVTLIKKKLLDKPVGPSRINSILNALKSFLNYCREQRMINTIDPKEIKLMKIPKREVKFLKIEDIQKFFESLNVRDIRDLRMRVLWEVLLASGMRISECLSINKSDIDWESKEVVIIGKGNKQRTVHFKDRTVDWLNVYFLRRKDDNPALFVTHGKPKRLTRHDLSKQFKRYVMRAGLSLHVTPHILRHTMATIILHNGGDITVIRDLLGHSDIQTTAQYYLGTDKEALKKAHNKYLNF